MKLLITAFGLAVIAYACQNKFSSAQKASKKDLGSTQTFFSADWGQSQLFTGNTSNYIFTNTEKRNSIALSHKALGRKNHLPVTNSINVKTKEITTARETVPNRGQKSSDGYHSFPAEDFLFVSLIMVN